MSPEYEDYPSADIYFDYIEHPVSFPSLKYQYFVMKNEEGEAIGIFEGCTDTQVRNVHHALIDGELIAVDSWTEITKSEFDTYVAFHSLPVFEFSDSKILSLPLIKKNRV